MAAISLVAGGSWQLSPWIHTLQWLRGIQTTGYTGSLAHWLSGSTGSLTHWLDWFFGSLAQLALWLSVSIGSLALWLTGIPTPCSVVALWTVEDGHLWTVQEQGRADCRDEQ